MNRSVKFLCIILCNELTSLVAGVANLTALSSGLYIRQFYLVLRNEDPPSKTDPATVDPASRFDICACITGSGYFKALQFLSVHPNVIFFNRKDSEYFSIFEDIFSPRPPNSYEYVNEYKWLRTTVDDSFYLSEQVFVCPLQDYCTGGVFPLYVSKEYNVGALAGQHKPGRFLFIPAHNYKPILAEEPAIAYVAPDFSVELHYLQIKKYIEPGKSYDTSIDPLCKLISNDRNDPRNQHYRLCTAVYRSLYFKDEVNYRKHTPYPCLNREITFQTAEALRLTDGQSYYENLTLCFTTHIRRKENHELGSFLYISRAYKSNQVFVYRRYLDDGKIYLENLSYNISIVDQLNSFDFVEE